VGQKRAKSLTTLNFQENNGLNASNLRGVRPGLPVERSEAEANEDNRRELESLILR